MQGHIAGVLILLAEVAKRNFQLIAPFIPLITGVAVQKWFTQCGSLTEFFVRFCFVFKREIIVVTVLVWKTTNNFSTVPMFNVNLWL